MVGHRGPAAGGVIAAPGGGSPRTLGMLFAGEDSPELPCRKPGADPISCAGLVGAADCPTTMRLAPWMTCYIGAINNELPQIERGTRGSFAGDALIPRRRTRRPGSGDREPNLNGDMVHSGVPGYAVRRTSCPAAPG